LIRCSTSVAANYRAARRGKSRADFLYKIKIVEEEADESVFWLEMLTEINPTNLEGSEDLLQEARELTAIFSASSKTPKAKT
jgi:four helix bundle protein